MEHKEIITFLLTTIAGAIFREIEKRKLRKKGTLIDKIFDSSNNGQGKEPEKK